MRYLKFSIILAGGFLMSACTQEAGVSPELSVYGTAVNQNNFTQIAYGDPEARLRNLAIDFAAETQDTVNFEFDRSSLDRAARRALDTQVKWLKEHPGVRMTVIGHTDLVGSERYNDGLGLRRARSVVAYLSRKGISRKRLDAVESKGESEPVVQTEDRELRNRRTVTTVAGFERGYVGDGLDGEVAARIYDIYQRGGFTADEAETGDVGG
ncbi:MAG: OmpA family protein [Pseudomonadota bacterium]